MQQNNPRILHLPAGVTVKTFYDNCPRCGCDLQQVFESECDQAQAENIQDDANEAGVPVVVNHLERGCVVSTWQYRFAYWVVHPFGHTPAHASQANHESLSDWVRRQQTGTVEQYHERADHDDHFVPRIKGKFRQRIFHFLFRLLGGRYE